MRIIDRSQGKPLRIDERRLKDLGDWLQEERLRSGSARDAIERGWMDDLRMYAGIPPSNQPDIPIEQAPNLEITLGAIATEGIYASLIELVFQQSQVVVALPRKRFEQYAEAVQDYLDWGCREAFNVKQAVNVSTFDCIQLGSMALYIPYTERAKVTDVYKVTHRGPRIVPIAIEDFWLPEGSHGNIQEDRWCMMDMWLSPSDVTIRAKRNSWDVSSFKPAANISQVRQKRLDVARERSSEPEKGDLYQIAYTCCEFDIDNDGVDEDLEVIWDVTSANVGKVSYLRYDLRPFEFAVYQIQPHVAWGKGVMSMCGPYEDEVSQLHNERVLNTRLANARIWKAKNVIASWLEKLWPGKVVRVSAMDDFMGEAMADVYPSTAQAEMLTVAFAERRTGMADLQSGAGKLGTRTPGISALSYMQAANRRFAPAFMNIRDCIAAATRQCMYRDQERVRAGDEDRIEDLRRIMGDEKGKDGKSKFDLLMEFFTKVDDLVEAFDVQVTAASVSINREADRQNMTMLMQLGEKYAQGIIQLQALATNSPTPEGKQMATDLIQVVNRLWKRMLRTFETISDVEAYTVELKGAEELLGNLPPELQKGLAGLTGQMGQIAQNGGGPLPPTQPPGAPEGTPIQ